MSKVERIATVGEEESQESDMEDDENNFGKIMGNRQIIDNEEADGEEEEQDQFTTAKT